MPDEATGTTGPDGSGAGGPGPDAPDLDVVVVGAGFSGLYLLHRLRTLGFAARAYDTRGRRRRYLVLEPVPGCPL